MTLSPMRRAVRDCPTCKDWYISNRAWLRLQAQAQAALQQQTPEYLLRAWLELYHIAHHDESLTTVAIAVRLTVS
jgi:hypothetical protein